jgi:hypothetical protein
MQMNEYDREAILRRFRDPLVVPTDHGGIEGAIVIGRRQTG